MTKRRVAVVARTVAIVALLMAAAATLSLFQTDHRLQGRWTWIMRPIVDADEDVGDSEPYQNARAVEKAQISMDLVMEMQNEQLHTRKIEVSKKSRKGAGPPRMTLKASDVQAPAKKATLKASRLKTGDHPHANVNEMGVSDDDNSNDLSPDLANESTHDDAALLNLESPNGVRRLNLGVPQAPSITVVVGSTSETEADAVVDEEINLKAGHSLGEKCQSKWDDIPIARGTIKKFMVTKRIPKIIHHLWLNASAGSPVSDRGIASWIEQNPGYEHKIHSHHDVEKFLVENFTYRIYKAVMSMPRDTVKSAFLRYAIVMKYGGVFADSSTICLSSVDRWTFGRSGAQVIISKEPDSPGMYSTHAFAAIPKHPIIQMAVDKLINRLSVFSHPQESMQGSKYDSYGGPKFFGEVVNQYFVSIGTSSMFVETNNCIGRKLRDVLVLEATAFNPADLDDPDAMVSRSLP